MGKTGAETGEEGGGLSAFGELADDEDGFFAAGEEVVPVGGEGEAGDAVGVPTFDFAAEHFAFEQVHAAVAAVVVGVAVGGRGGKGVEGLGFGMF